MLEHNIKGLACESYLYPQITQVALANLCKCVDE